MDCKNYRPISLLNVDTKILAKLLAERLKIFLPTLIRPDQVGFVPGREAKDATTRVLNALTLAHSSKKELLLFSADAEKAFDRVRWSYLFEVLRQMGLPEGFLGLISALYSSPSARVRIDGALSRPIRICNGTRQGCPLSPLLFALYLEPLLEAVRGDQRIRGIRGHRLTHVVSAYADDLMFMLSDAGSSLPEVLRLMEENGRFSGFKINQEKSDLLPINLPTPLLRYMQTHYPFIWCTDKLKYLGIWIPSSHLRLYDCNYKPILSSFEKDMAGWTSKFISWIGRVNVIKMNIMPRLLYIMQTVPIQLPQTFFSLFRSSVLKFIWPKGRPRLNFETLCRPKTHGGLALPNAKLYAYAVHLTRLLDWSSESPHKLWLDLEEAMLNLPLWAAPWIRPRDLPEHILPWSLPLESLRIWRRVRFSHSLTSSISPLLPLRHNPGFIPGVCQALTNRFELPVRLTVSDYLRDGNPPPLTRTEETQPITFAERFNYLQINSFLTSLKAGYSLMRPLTPFEKFFRLGLPLSKGISTIYHLLTNSSNDTPSFQGRWQALLDLPDTEDTWNMTYTLTHRSSPALRCAENAYKILSFWYWTPDRIHRMSPQTDPVCWRCSLMKGTYLHIWWECSLLVPFWKMVHDAVGQISGLTVQFTPATYLLLQFQAPISAMRKSVAIRLVMAAKLAIPLYWGSKTIPSRKTWIDKIETLRAVDRLVALDRDQIAEFRNLWFYWDDYVSNGLRVIAPPTTE
uniref:Reverse transcriptase domain-containing protein n=1 Tax=Leptobrachium leishanense TaxID=445787 RepID=A0A8C5QB56_9ANUR